MTRRSAVLEVQNEARVRVRAPITTVWGEFCPLDQLFRLIPEVESFEMDPGGTRGQIWARLAWGPLDWTLVGHAEVVETSPPRRFSVAGTIPSLHAAMELTLDVSAGANREAVLDYRAVVRCDHRLAHRLRGVLASGVENHVESLTARVATRAVQHAQAEQRLRYRSVPGSR